MERFGPYVAKTSEAIAKYGGESSPSYHASRSGVRMRVRFIDNGEQERRRAIEQAIREQMNVLRVPEPAMVTDDGSDPEPGDFIVFLGGDRAPATLSANLAAVTSLAAIDGRMLPVLRQAPDAVHLPDPLKPVNALIESRYGEHWPHAVVDEILSRALLRRTVRRVFISYRRIDSLGIARQLHEALSRLGFEVFLDEVDIEHGVMFQQSLRTWLLDADLVLVLASPRYEQSRWTMEEIAVASNASIGMLAVTWPDALYGPQATVEFAGTKDWSRPSVLRTAELRDETCALALDDLVDPGQASVRGALDRAPERVTLSAEAVERLVGGALRARTGAIRARLETLLANAMLALEPLGTVEAIGERGDLVLHDEDGEVLVRVVPFRPTARTLYEVWCDARPQGYGATAVYYSEVDVETPDVAVLRWLSQGTQPESPRRARLYMEVGGRMLR